MVLRVQAFPGGHFNGNPDPGGQYSPLEHPEPP